MQQQRAVIDKTNKGAIDAGKESGDVSMRAIGNECDIMKTVADKQTNALVNKTA